MRFPRRFYRDEDRVRIVERRSYRLEEVGIESRCVHVAFPGVVVEPLADDLVLRSRRRPVCGPLVGIVPDEHALGGVAVLNIERIDLATGRAEADPLEAQLVRSPFERFE